MYSGHLVVYDNTGLNNNSSSSSRLQHVTIDQRTETLPSIMPAEKYGDLMRDAV